MASHDPPKQPAKRSEGREQANRIADISHRTSEMGHSVGGAIRDLGNKISALANQIQADSKTADTREKEQQDRSFLWVKVGTISSIVLSVFSVVTSGIALSVLYNQLYVMRIEQRAWIKIEHKGTQMEENKPLIAELIIKNIGKTPAKRIDASFMIRTVKKADVPDLKLSGTAFGAFSGLVNPDGVIPVPVTMLKGEEDMLNPPVLTKEDFVKFKSGETYVVRFWKTYLFRCLRHFPLDRLLRLATQR